MQKYMLRCDSMIGGISCGRPERTKCSASANRVRKCSFGRGARSNQREDDTTTRPCDGKDVLGEIEGRLWIMRNGLAFGF
jgi:hypothetical protein